MHTRGRKALGILLAIFLGAPGAEAGSTHRGGNGNPRGPQGYTADDEGFVRVNVVYSGLAGKERARGRLAARLPGRVRHALDTLPAQSIQVREADLAEALTALAADPEVRSVEPDRRLAVLGEELPWGVWRIDAPVAHAAGVSAAGVKVAVLDTGIWYDRTRQAVHTDLEAAYRGGYDFVNRDAEPWDDNGHGTHVAGTIVAARNGVGVIGVAPGAELYVLKVLDANGEGWESDLAAGLDWCIGNGVRVANYSAGGYEASSIMEAACRTAFDAGVTVVAAAGNGGVSASVFPAAYEKVRAVGATGGLDRRASFSNYGVDLDIMGPGVGILSTAAGGGYSDGWVGTSMASPHVAGAAALVVGAGLRSPADVMARLKGTATDLGAAGRDNLYGWGLVSAARALSLEAGLLTSPGEGTILAAGSAATASWRPVVRAASYDLQFSPDNGRTWKTVLTGAESSPARWRVPKAARNLRNCRLRVTARSARGSVIAWDVSPRFTVRVVWFKTPAEGEAVASGVTYPVSWAVKGTVSPVARIVLSSSRDGGRTWARVARMRGTARARDWSVPQVAEPTACRLRLDLYDAAGRRVGVTSTGFTILAP